MENEERQASEVPPSTANLLAPLPHCHTVALQEAEARQVARTSKHLLAASMGTSHSVADGGGFPSMFPHAGVSWQTLPGSRTNGLFILPP